VPSPIQVPNQGTTTNPYQPQYPQYPQYPQQPQYPY
jgi:hypothetical protein